MNRILFVTTLWIGASQTAAAQDSEAPNIFAKSNLVAWCIVPFDAKQRSPAERALMLKRLGLSAVAYDWRKEHVDSFEEEIVQYRKQGIEYFAFWSWHDAMRPLIKKHGIRPQVWQTNPSPKLDSQQARIEAAAEQLQPLVEMCRDLGLSLGLYNHGGWGGEPVNLVAVCRYLRRTHNAERVGIVYNMHHGHEHVQDFPKSLELMKPYLLCLNLNGMADVERVHRSPQDYKILPIGSGRHEKAMLRQIARSGYQGRIGILDHRPEVDAERSLQANLRGLEQLLRTIDQPNKSSP